MEKIFWGLFEHERLKPTILRTSEGNVSNLVKLKQLINTGLTLTLQLNEILEIYYLYTSCSPQLSISRLEAENHAQESSYVIS